MTNEEIADFLAERVMEWTRVNADSDSPMANHAYYDAAGEFVMVVRDYHPTTDLNQAVQAAEKKTYQHASWNVGHYPEGYVASCGVTTYRGGYTPADALARAVVKAAGGTP